MFDSYQRLWTLEDYRRFLQHAEPLIRGWAADRIETQYPDQAAESFVGLLTDPDRHLRITAARAIGQSGEARYEPALLALFPESQGFVRNWFRTTLGQLRSPALLPELISQLDGAPGRCPPEEADMLALRSAVEALGYYPDAAAQSALWQFVARYRDDDRLAYTAFQGLLRWADPAGLARLVKRFGRLQPGSETWWHTPLALAEPVGLDRLTQEAAALDPDDLNEAILLIDEWLQQEIPYSETLEQAFDAVIAEEETNLLPHLLAEFERVAAARGDDLPTWRRDWSADQRPTGYRWRMLYAHQVLTCLTEDSPSQPTQHHRAMALGLALLAQALIDQNDELQLQAAPNELIRQAVLLSILGSSRPNVLPDVVNRVAALGPGVLPHLIDILEAGQFWAQPRALEVITELARAYPGSAEPAIPAILELLDGAQSDYVLEPAETTLLALGPAVIVPAAARLGQVDYVYDIYICSALGNIPTHASASLLLSYIASKPAMEEYEAEVLADLGHPTAIPFLRDRFDWRDDPLLCTILYKLALLNDYRGPGLVRWRAMAVSDYQKFMDHLDEDKPAPPAPAEQDQAQAEDEKKRKKQKWTLAEAKRKEQKKKKRR